MACPTCGGTQRKAIAPGLWECQSTVTEYAPGATSAGIVGVAPVVAHTRPCTTRYQEGAHAASDPPSCVCGMFAVATCTQCRQPVCGDCLMRVAGSVYCTQHGREVRAAELAETQAHHATAAKDHAARQAAKAAARDQARLEVPALLSRLREAGSPGAQDVHLTTWERRRGLLGRSRTDPVFTTLAAWELAAYTEHRSVPGTDSGATFDVRAWVDANGRYFTTARRQGGSIPEKPDTDSVFDAPAEVVLRAWEERAARESGPFDTKTRHGGVHVTWQDVHARLTELLATDRAG